MDLDGLLKELAYVVAHMALAVAGLVLFKTLAAGPAGDAIPAVRTAAATA